MEEDGAASGLPAYPRKDSDPKARSCFEAIHLVELDPRGAVVLSLGSAKVGGTLTLGGSADVGSGAVMNRVDAETPHRPGASRTLKSAHLSCSPRSVVGFVVTCRRKHLGGYRSRRASGPFSTSE